MNKQGMSFTFLILILLVAVIGFAVQQNPNFNIENFKGNLSWREINLNVTEAPELGEALEDGINGLGGALLGIARWAADLARENPDVPWKLIIIGVVLAIIAPIILIVVKLGALIFILTKEIIQSRKEKKLLKNEPIVKKSTRRKK